MSRFKPTHPKFFSVYFIPEYNMFKTYCLFDAFKPVSRFNTSLSKKMLEKLIYTQFISACTDLQHKGMDYSAS